MDHMQIDRSVAVVIPVRNRASLIGDAIASVQAQSMPVHEIIVVDDGSTDATPDAVAELARDDGRIRLLKNSTGQGASAARNRGIAAATCDWIAFLDSDDRWHPAKNAAQNRCLDANDGAVACFTGWTEPIGHAAPPAHITMEMLRGRNWPGPTSVAMVRRSVLLASGGFDPRMPSCQDWDLWLRIRERGEFAVVPEALMSFNKAHGARISTNQGAVLQGHAELFRRALLAIDDRRARARIAAEHNMRMAEIHFWEFGQPGRGLLFGLRSLSLNPTRRAAQLARSAARQMLRHTAARLRLPPAQVR